MQTINNIYNRQIDGILTNPFGSLLSGGLNPYIIFIFLVIIVFLICFIVLYQGSLKLLIENFKEMTPAKKRTWFIFLFGGIFVALMLFYESLDIFYGQNDVGKYHLAFIDNNLSNMVAGITSFLEKIGIIK